MFHEVEAPIDEGLCIHGLVAQRCGEATTCPCADLSRCNQSASTINSWANSADRSVNAGFEAQLVNLVRKALHAVWKLVAIWYDSALGISSTGHFTSAVVAILIALLPAVVNQNVLVACSCKTWNRHMSMQGSTNEENQCQSRFELEQPALCG